MKILLILLLLIHVNTKGNGQDTVKNHRYNYPNNNIFVELAGNAYFFGSLNYERVLVKQKDFYLNGRLGIGYGNYWPTSILSLPIGFNAIIQIYQAFAWEIGFGLSLMHVKRSDASPRNSLLDVENIAAIIPSTGFRIQDKDGFLLRIDFTPFYNLDSEGQLLPSKRFKPWVGLSIGYRIGKNRK